jgi:hypothetical protein
MEYIGDGFLSWHESYVVTTHGRSELEWRLEMGDGSLEEQYFNMSETQVDTRRLWRLKWQLCCLYEDSKLKREGLKYNEQKEFARREFTITEYFGDA